MLKNDINAIN